MGGGCLREVVTHGGSIALALRKPPSLVRTCVHFYQSASIAQCLKSPITSPYWALLLPGSTLSLDHCTG